MQKRIGIRFFITYACVALPFLTMSILLHSSSMGQLRRDAQAQLETRLQRVISGLETQYARYYEGSAHLASIPELSPAAMRSSAVSAQRGMNRLKTVYFFDRTIDDLLLYYDAEHLYGSEGLASAAVYLRNDLRLSGAAYETALACLVAREPGAAILPREENEGCVLFHYFMSSGISMNYCVNYSTLAAFLQGLAGDENALISLSFSGSAPILFGPQNGGLKCLTGAEAQAVQAKEKWCTLSGKSAVMDARVELLVDERLMYAGVNRTQLANYALLIVGMLLSGLLSVSLASRRLTHLRNLENAVKGRGEGSGEVGEFADIHAVIQQANWNNIALMRHYRSALREQTARLLFHGLLREEKEYAPLLDKCDVELAEEYFFVVGFCTEEVLDVSTLLAERLYCAAEAGKRMAYYYLEELPNLDETGQLRRNRGERLQETLRAAGVRRALIALSVPVDCLGIIDYAYMSAMAELNRRLEAGGEAAGVFIARESPALEEYALSPGALEELARALQDYNAPRAQRALKKILQQTARAELPTEIRRYLNGGVVQVLASAVNKSENPADEALRVLLGQTSPEEAETFFARMNDIVEQYCRHNTASENGEEIIRYVQNNYCRADISLEEMASHFSVSREHMSRLFRARTGMRYIDYITKLRMESAWRLITTTTQSVSDIFRLVGYIDRSSSTKKFKKFFGVTPSEARSRAGLSRGEDKEMG